MFIEFFGVKGFIEILASGASMMCVYLCSIDSVWKKTDSAK